MKTKSKGRLLSCFWKNKLKRGINMNQDYIVRAMAANHQLRIFAASSKNLVERARQIHGTINSAYRTESYNKKVGGAKSSYHMKGQAFDIVVKSHTPLEVARFAQSIGITGIIQYNNFVHVDSRQTKYWARNDNGKVYKKESFA